MSLQAGHPTRLTNHLIPEIVVMGPLTPLLNRYPCRWLAFQLLTHQLISGTEHSIKHAQRISPKDGKLLLSERPVP